jgi:hypothetical protein
MAWRGKQGRALGHPPAASAAASPSVGSPDEAASHPEPEPASGGESATDKASQKASEMASSVKAGASGLAAKAGGLLKKK